MRLDYNLTDNHRLTGSWSSITAKRTPDYLNNADPRFPGAPNQRDFVSKRPLISMSLRSVLSKNIVNELRGGLTAYASGSNFGYPSSIALAQRSRARSPTRAASRSPRRQHDRLVHVQHPELAHGADLQHRRHADLAAERAHDHCRRQRPASRTRSSSGQQMVRGSRSGFNTDFDPAAGLFNTDQLPRRVERAADRRARHVRGADRPGRQRHQPGRAATRHGQVRGARRRARSRAASRSSACSRRTPGG